MPTVLFVGGPRDGDRLALTDLPHVFAVWCFGREPGSANVRESVSIVEYQLLRLSSGNLIYVFQGMTGSQAIDALVANYRPPGAVESKRRDRPPPEPEVEFDAERKVIRCSAPRQMLRVDVDTMSTQQPKPKSAPELSERDAECLIYEALKRDGKFLPRTPEEIEAAEAELGDEEVQLPPALQDPLAILSWVDLMQWAEAADVPIVIDAEGRRQSPR